VEKLSMHSDRTGRELQASEELGRLLGMKKIPVRIESYDISNLASADMVAGMVVFENGRPLKAAYRKFSIKSLAGQNDYAAMQEVIRRRFGEYFKAQEENDPIKNAANAFAILPDLILLDGGQTHVAAIAPILAELHLDIPLFGMVKNDKHRTRAIATDGGEIAVRDKQTAFHLLTRIQDEVHRFSITYMKAKHKKNSFTLTLTAVPGIGEKKAQKLLMTFRTREQLLAASPEELAKAAGVNIDTANALWQHIQENM
jgi:excinuclease ABC subunit C